jgi:DNA topoisomerase-3
VPGWRVLFAAAPAEESDPDQEEGPAEDHALPVLKDGEPVTATDVSIAEKSTEPPKRFTHATLVQAMTGIARFVKDPKVKQILRETDGIGTPATQAAIIETLFQRNYIEQRKKQIVSTPTGRALVQTLPTVATTPDMTAVWESAMRRISDGAMLLDDFLGRVLAQLRELIARGKAAGPLKVPSIVSPQPRRSTGFRKKRGGTAAAGPKPHQSRKENPHVD